MPAPAATSPSPAELRSLLARLGTHLIACGLPVGEVEDDVRRVAVSLGVADPQLAATPTMVTLALASGEPATVERVGAPLHLDQVADVTLINHLLATNAIGWREAQSRLDALDGAPPRRPLWLTDLSWIVIACGIALLMQPGWANLLVVAACALVVSGFLALARRSRVVATLLPLLAAFTVGVLVLLAADAGVIDGALRTMLPPLAILLPGGMLVTGVSELVEGHMVAGSSRLTFALVQLSMAAAGIVLAVNVVGPDQALLANIRIDQLGPFAAVAGIVLISVGISLNESVPWRLTPWVTGCLAVTCAAQFLGQEWSQTLAVGTFVGAVAATLGSRVVAVLRPRLPRLVVFLPSFWVLVPGSLGLTAVTQLDWAPETAAQSAMSVVFVIGAIVIGLILGAAIAQTLTAGGRRVRARISAARTR